MILISLKKEHKIPSFTNSQNSRRAGEKVIMRLERESRGSFKTCVFFENTALFGIV